MSELSWSRENFKSDFDTYDTFIDGTLNISRFHDFPLTVSLPFFSGAQSLIDTQNLVVRIDETALKDMSPAQPFIHTERFSGFVFNSSLPLMYSIVLKQESPKVEGGVGYFSNLLAQDFFIPVFIVTENFSYSDEGVSFTS